MAEELSASMGAPMGGFFDRADIVFATPASSVVALGVPTEATTLPIKSVPIDEGTHTGRLIRPLLFLPRHLLPERWPLLLLLSRPRLLLLSHPSSSPPVTPLQFYLRL